VPVAAGRQRSDLFAGHEIAVSGHQQDRRGDGGAQAEQAFRAIGDQQVWAARSIIVMSVATAPMGQQGGEQFGQPLPAQ
jgi:hypothetical protein